MRFLYIFIITLCLSWSGHAAIEIAKVGEKTITDSDLKVHLGKLPNAEKNKLLKNAQTRSRLVDNLVTEELFVQEASRKGIPKQEEFKLVLEQTKRRLMAQKLIQDEIQPKINEKNMRRYFKKNRRSYSRNEVRASHILLPKKNEADEVYALAVKKGANFSELAKKHSKDPTVKHNLGDLGYFTRERMVPEFSKAAFAMKKGQISKPVKSQFGYHIIKLIDKKNGKPVKFEDVAARVRGDLQNNEIQQMVDRLKKKGKVKVNRDNLKKLSF